MTSTTSGPTDSLWLAMAPPTAYPALDDDVEVDVAVIGGGIAGAGAALAGDGSHVFESTAVSDVDGAVLAGPAVTALERRDVD